MADFIVQEDGTSKIELEDSSGFLITEESSPASRSASFTADASISATPSPPPFTHARWRVGTVTVPGSTGAVAYTPAEMAGKTPKAMWFFGTNFLTEDTAVTTSGTGLFQGMAAPKWDDPGTMLQSGTSVIPTGDAHSIENSYAIEMLNTSGGVTGLYAGRVDSFDVGGFTIDWLVAASGGYKVVWIALLESSNVGAYNGTSTTLSLGWKAGASLLHGALGGPTANNNDMTREFFGGGAYPGTSPLGWMGAGLTAYAFPGSAFQQYLTQIYDDPPSTVIAQDGNFIGPFFSSEVVTAYPSGGSLTDFTVSTNLGDTPAMVVIWDDEDSATGRELPGAATTDTVTVSGLSFAPGLVIGYTISNEPPGQGSSDPFGARGAVGFSVISPDFQWTAVVDGVDSRGSFQSYQRGFSDTVDGTDVHAGTVELTQDGFVMTTEEDTVAPNDWVWHAFGHPDRLPIWLPHIYRRVFG